MKKDDLLQFIDTGFIPSDFYKQLDEEVSQYKDSVSSLKGVKNIYGEDMLETAFDRQMLVALLKSYLNGKIFEWELEYILNFIEMSFESDDEKVEEVVFSLSDPYLNFPITYGNVIEAIQYLEDELDSMNLKPNRQKSLREGYRSLFTVR